MNMIAWLTAGINNTLLMAPSVPSGTQSTAPGWTSFVPMILMMVVFYFLLIRPQQVKAKEHEKVLDSLETGDEVVTTGGILGVVTNRKEKTVVIKVADNVRIEVLRSAIQTVKKPDGKTSSNQ